MSVSLADVRRIVTEVAARENAALDVIAATPTEGAANYTEVILTIRTCAVEPCRIVIGVNRDTSEHMLRAAVRQRLEQHLDEHSNTSSKLR